MPDVPTEPMLRAETRVINHGPFCCQPQVATVLSLPTASAIMPGDADPNNDKAVRLPQACPVARMGIPIPVRMVRRIPDHVSTAAPSGWAVRAGPDSCRHERRQVNRAGQHRRTLVSG